MPVLKLQYISHNAWLEALPVSVLLGMGKANN